MRWATALVSMVLLAVVGCGGSDDEAVPSPEPTSSTTDCGSYEATHQSTTEFRNQQQCLIDAFTSGTPAALAYRYPSEEGDLIDVRLEVLGPRRIEVETDTRADNFAVTRAVTSKRCEGLAIDGPLMHATRCR